MARRKFSSKTFSTFTPPAAAGPIIPRTQHISPTRDWLANLVWCHQKLNFKDGAYKVRWQSGDHLVIERSARALITANDHWTAAQTATVQTDFGANVLLHDYSGANPNDIRTDASGRATITTPPCNGTNLRRGYSVWAPAGITGGFDPARKTTTQEWEMFDDLGDSHPSSLQQGGNLPANSTATRTVGRIYPAAATPVRIEGYASLNGPNWRITVHNNAGQELATTTAPHNQILTFTPTTGEYHTILIRNEAADNPAQKVCVKSIYTSLRNRLATPPVITTQLTNIFAVEGEPITLTLAATGNPAPNYRWFHNNQLLPQATPTLQIPSATQNHTGSYKVRLTNEAGQIDSAEIQLTIHPNATPQIANLAATPTTFTFTVQGPTGLRYELQRSDDLATWTSVQTFTTPFSFEEQTTATRQFYRLIHLPN